MATNRLWLNAVRHPEDTGIGYLRRTVNFDTPAPDSNGVPIGALEAGCVPLGCNVTIETGFTAGATLNVGIIGDTDGYAATADIVPATPAYKPNLVGSASGIPLAANTVVYAKLAGTAAIVGKATIVLTFANKREVEGTAFPAN